MNIFLCYTKCSTCKKARHFLDNHNISYEFRDIKLNNPTFEELSLWISLSDKKVSDFFNKSGLMYKELNLKDKLEFMSEEEQIRLLSTNGMLLKRPLLIINDKVLIGFNEKIYEELL